MMAPSYHTTGTQQLQILFAVYPKPRELRILPLPALESARNLSNLLGEKDLRS
jgi:hypothetical protein